MRRISTDLGSIYSSLDLRLYKFESSVTKALQGFYKLQTGTEKASSIMDKSIYTSVSNISKSYELWEKANENTGRSIFDNSQKINSFKSQLKLLDSEIQKSEKTLEDIEKQLGSNSKEAEEYRSHVLDLKLSHSQLASEMAKVQKETGTFAGRLDLLGKEFSKIDDKYKSFNSIGDSFSGIGNKLTLGLTLPIIGAGTAASKFAMDFETGMAKVGTIADTTKVPIDKLKAGVIDLSNKTGISTKELNEALYETISAGVDTSNAVGFLGNATALAKGGFTSAAQAIDILTTVLNSYGLQASESSRISDILIQVQNKGKTTVDELSSSMGKVIPTAKANNVAIEQLGAAYALMTSKGIATAETTTYVNSMLNELGKTGTDVDKTLREVSGKSFPQLMAEGKNLSDVLNLLNDYAIKNNLSLSDLFSSSEAAKAGLVLATEGGSQFNTMLADVNNSVGATDSAFKKMSETTEAKFNKALNQAKNSAMELGVKLLPLIEKGINLFSDLTDKFNALSPSTQEWIIKVGLATAALGPFMSAIGGTIKGIGGLVSTGEKIGTFFGAFNSATAVAGAVEGVGTAATVATGASTGGGILGLGTSLGGLVVAAAPWLLAGAAVVGTGYAIHKALSEEVIPTVDLFANEVQYTAQTMENFESRVDASMQNTVITISEGTKQAVGAYVDMDNQAKNTLDSLYLNSTVITENIKNDTVSKYTEMFGTVKSKMANNNQEQLNLMNQYFLDFRGMDEKEKADLLSRLQSHNEYEISKIDNKELRIKEILEKASNERRALSIDEQQEIASIQNEMKETAVKVLSESETEAKVILQRMKEYDGRITAEQASEHIKKLNESKDKAITATNEEYDKRVATIIKMRDDAKVITDEQAEIMINNATRQRDDVIKKAEEMKTEAVKKITDMNSDLVKNVDTETGKILTFWDKLKNWWSSWWPEPKNAVISITETSNTAADYVDRKGGIPKNASGTRYFAGGLTTMHERGYEVYNLPQGSRIYNHQASEALIKETAKQVAESVLSSSRGNGVNQEINIYSPEALTPSEVARQVKNASRQFALDW